MHYSFPQAVLYQQHRLTWMYADRVWRPYRVDAPSYLWIPYSSDVCMAGMRVIDVTTQLADALLELS
jgi:hypothetical protein